MMNSTLSDAKHGAVGEGEALALQLTSRLSARLYQDCYPRCMETSALQKGLILTFDGKELIEEGLGFGVPVVKYRDKTYFSSLARISFGENRSTSWATKTFVMDTVSRKKFWRLTYINDTFYSSMRKIFEKLYLRNKDLALLFNAVMAFRETAKIKTEFNKVRDRGVVAVTYNVQPGNVAISVDFSNLTLEGCKELLILNEQGSTTFSTYTDTDGLKLSRRKIGAWDPVTAKTASLVNDSGNLSFSLQKLSRAHLFRGWERTRNRFSWAGLSYSLYPNQKVFNYTIKLSVPS